MSRKRVVIGAVLVGVVWSTAMAALGQLSAVSALLPSLGLLVQQSLTALTSPEPRPPAGSSQTAAVHSGREEPPR
ncbi:hypothetical protein ACFU99_04765 [Streptomyces sp. NPDC057654]|uniref:hypothetical protein n=1 Tax=Streptomyces sp. NPDC057654 TaxID=3346196 RepID=UPI00367EA8CD